MGKRFAAFFLLLTLLVSSVIPAQAYDESSHNELICSILFEENPVGLSQEAQQQLSLLLDATTICLDQYQGSYVDKLDALNRQKIHGIPKNINEINFRGNQYHRRYTHKGWDFSYPSETGNWPARKTLLLQTVNHVFEFQDRAGQWGFLWWNKDYGYDKQCNSFAAFLYYLHILGEYEQAAEDTEDQQGWNTHYKTTYGSVIPLAVAHPGDNNSDVFWELEKHLPVIFEEQKKDGSHNYTGMITDIQILAGKARRLAAQKGGITAENFSEYCRYATELIGILEERIPVLLEKEEFFSEKFC